MTVNIDETLSWETATGDDETMLENLQPNILKGHVRDFLSVIFLRFDDAAEGRAFLGLVRQAVLALVTDGITVLAEEHGRTLSNTAGDGIEHLKPACAHPTWRLWHRCGRN